MNSVCLGKMECYGRHPVMVDKQPFHQVNVASVLSRRETQTKRVAAG